MPRPDIELINWNPSITPNNTRIIMNIFVGMFKKSFIANNKINGSKQAYNGPSTGTNNTKKRTVSNPIELHHLSRKWIGFFLHFETF